MHHIFIWTLSSRQGLYNLFGGCSGGGHEICELPACKWLSNCCKYSFRRKLLSTKREKRQFFKKHRRYTVHLNVFLFIITFCRLKKIQIERTSLGLKTVTYMICLFVCSYFNWISCFEMCFNNDPGKFHFVTPDTRWAIVWGFVSYSINFVSYLICNINIKKGQFSCSSHPSFFSAMLLHRWVFRCEYLSAKKSSKISVFHTA